MNNLSAWTSPLLALIVTIGIVALIALRVPVPGELWGAFGIVIGFFFGTGQNKSIS